jgi:hypothetical protein
MVDFRVGVLGQQPENFQAQMFVFVEPAFDFESFVLGAQQKNFLFLTLSKGETAEELRQLPVGSKQNQVKQGDKAKEKQARDLFVSGGYDVEKHVKQGSAELAERATVELLKSRGMEANIGSGGSGSHQ